MLLIFIKTHLFIHSIFNLSSFPDLDNTWSISRINQSNLIITIYFIQLTNFNQIIDNFTTIRSPQYLFSLSTLSFLDIFIPTFDSSFISLVYFPLSNWSNIDILIKNIKLTNWIISIQTTSLSSILPLNRFIESLDFFVWTPISQILTTWSVFESSHSSWDMHNSRGIICKVIIRSWCKGSTSLHIQINSTSLMSVR